MIFFLQLFLGAVAFTNVKYQWTFLNYTFETPQQYQNYYTNKVYEDCIPHSLAADKSGNIYLSVPRLSGLAPATLVRIKSTSEPSPLLEPYPSWEMNDHSSHSHLYSVSALQVDTDNNLWAVDQGVIQGTLTKSAAKLVQFSGDKTTQYSLEEVVTENSLFVDLALDLEQGRAYISDGSPVSPAIIKVDLNSKKATRVITKGSSVSPDKALWITVNQEHRVTTEMPFEQGVSGLTLSCDLKTLYYAPLTSRYIYSADTTTFSVKNLGFRWSAGSSLISSRDGNLYIAGVETRTVYEVKSVQSSLTNLQFNVHHELFSNSQMNWPSKICFTDDNHLLVLSNQYQQYLNRTIDFANINFLVWSLPKEDASYLEGCDFDHDNHDSSTFPLWAVSVIVFVALLFLLMVFCLGKYVSDYRKKQRRKQETRVLLDQ